MDENGKERPVIPLFIWDEKDEEGGAGELFEKSLPVYLQHTAAHSEVVYSYKKFVNN